MGKSWIARFGEMSGFNEVAAALWSADTAKQCFVQKDGHVWAIRSGEMLIMDPVPKSTSGAVMEDILKLNRQIAGWVVAVIAAGLLAFLHMFTQDAMMLFASLLATTTGSAILYGKAKQLETYKISMFVTNVNAARNPAGSELGRALIALADKHNELSVQDKDLLVKRAGARLQAPVAESASKLELVLAQDIMDVVNNPRSEKVITIKRPKRMSVAS